MISPLSQCVFSFCPYFIANILIRRPKSRAKPPADGHNINQLSAVNYIERISEYRIVAKTIFGF